MFIFKNSASQQRPLPGLFPLLLKQLFLTALNWCTRGVLSPSFSSDTLDFTGSPDSYRILPWQTNSIFNLLYLLKTSQIQCLCGSQRFGLSGCLRVSSHKFLYFFSEVSQNLSQKPNLGHSWYFPLFDGIVSGKEDVPHTSDCCTLICFYSAVPRISPQSPVFYDYAMLHNVHLQSLWRSCPFPLSLLQGPDGYRCCR